MYDPDKKQADVCASGTDVQIGGKGSIGMPRDIVVLY